MKILDTGEKTREKIELDTANINRARDLYIDIITSKTFIDSENEMLICPCCKSKHVNNYKIRQYCNYGSMIYFTFKNSCLDCYAKWESDPFLLIDDYSEEEIVESIKSKQKTAIVSILVGFIITAIFSVCCRLVTSYKEYLGETIHTFLLLFTFMIILVCIGFIGYCILCNLKEVGKGKKHLIELHNNKNISVINFTKSYSFYRYFINNIKRNYDVRYW